MKNKLKLVIIIYCLIFQIFLTIHLFKRIKVCICTIGKKENLYAREYVDYYKKRGINKIFLYDNNEKNGEEFDVILKDFIESGFVKIINVRGIIAPQMKAMEDCRRKNFRKYNWLIFFDMDEFLFLRDFHNINDFLAQKKFNKCQRIQLNWFFHTDNNLLYYDNRTLAQRFPKKHKKWKTKLGVVEGIKSILKGNIDIEISNIHMLNPKLISCDGFGKVKEVHSIYTYEADYHYYYIDHYFSKSTEEFVNKLMRGSGINGFKRKYSFNRISIYFLYNEVTLEKINYIENKTKFNLSKFRLRLKKV